MTQIHRSGDALDMCNSGCQTSHTSPTSPPSPSPREQLRALRPQLTHTSSLTATKKCHSQREGSTLTRLGIAFRREARYPVAQICEFHFASKSEDLSGDQKNCVGMRHCVPTGFTNMSEVFMECHLFKTEFRSNSSSSGKIQTTCPTIVGRKVLGWRGTHSCPQ